MMNRIAVIIVAAVVAAVLSVLGLAQASPQPKQPAKPPVTRISADRGPCSVQFRITDMLGHPVYNAQVSTTVKWGLFSMHKLDLQAATNSDGLVQFVRLPAQVKEPLTFTIKYGNDSATYMYDPGNDCHAEYTVPVGKKETPE